MIRLCSCTRRAGQIKKWEDTPEYLSYKGELTWYDKVKSKRTGEYYQAEDLIKRDMVDDKWEPPHVDAKGKPVKYPLKHTSEIIRKRIADGSEWLLSRQMWCGLNEAGSPVNQSFNDKECFDDILPIYKLRPENPRQRDSKMIRELSSIEHRIKYTKPFTKENVQKLYDLKNDRCSLVLKDESRGKNRRMK